MFEGFWQEKRVRYRAPMKPGFRLAIGLYVGGSMDFLRLFDNKIVNRVRIKIRRARSAKLAVKRHFTLSCKTLCNVE